MLGISYKVYVSRSVFFRGWMKITGFQEMSQQASVMGFCSDSGLSRLLEALPSALIGMGSPKNS